MSSLPPNACKDCGHVNEGERVYCHNCGTKLDRSILLTQQNEQDEPPEKKLKRIKKMMQPNAKGPYPRWKTAIKTLFFAVVAAALVDAALPPANVPVTPVDKFTDAPELGQALENLTATPSGMKVPLSVDMINGFLWNTVRVKPNQSWVQSIFKFQRVFVGLEPETLKVTLQNAILNYPLYATVDYRLKIENDALVPTPVDASIGRLQLPRELVPFLPKLMNYVNPPWESLKGEFANMGKLSEVQITKDQILLVAHKSAGPATPAVSGTAAGR